MKEGKTSLISKIFGHTFLLINIGTIIWLSLCAIAAYTSPQDIRHLALFSLTTPFAIVANVFFVIFWLFSRKKLRFLFSLVALVACYKIVLMIFGFNFGNNDMARAPGRVRIMTWNAHGMGVFNVPHSKPFDNRLLDFIQQTDADIVCLPEYYVPKHDVMKPFSSRIIKNNNYVDFRFKDDNTLGLHVFLGTAVFSKYPFKNYIAHQLAQYTFLLQGDIELPGGQMMRMFFVHFSTFGLSDDDKAYIEYIKRNSTAPGSGGLSQSRSFIWKFNYAYARRAAEVDKALAIINQSPYPVLICGDFNDLPASYTYTTLRGDLADAFLEKGRGLGRTYNQILPTLRIDHMFYDPAVLKPVGFDCSYTSLSDHNPVIVNFEIIPKAAN